MKVIKITDEVNLRKLKELTKPGLQTAPKEFHY